MTETHANIHTQRALTYSCPYIEDGRETTIALTDDTLTTSYYETLLSEGYRRYGNVAYKNVCAGCSACVPMRLRVRDFSPRKSMRRTLTKNKDVRVRITNEKTIYADDVELYTRYMGGKHDERVENALESLTPLHYGYENAFIMRYFLDDALIATGVVDITSNALSSNYCYYDATLTKRRLGIYTMCKEIEFGKRLGLHYYYPGFLNMRAPKMAYKAQFSPHEVYRSGEWRSQQMETE